MSVSESASHDDSTYGLSGLLREVFDLQEGTLGHHLNRLLKAARLHLGMEVAFVSEFSGQCRILRYVDQAGDVGVDCRGRSDPLEQTYCHRIIEGRLPELIHDAQELEETSSLAVTDELGIRAYLSTPIRMKDGSVYGTICTFSFSAHHELNERDSDLMRIFSEIASELIEKDVRRLKEEEAKAHRIQQLLESDAIRMVGQPIVDLGSESIVGVEALARFPDSELEGLREWFEEAEKAGLSDRLEGRAVALGLGLLDHTEPHQYVACNASATAILSGAVSEKLRNAPLERVVLEITEHDVIDDYQALRKTLSPLRKKGLRLAVDDAGAGYASMSHILHLRPDLIKLDMSLTRDVDSDVAKRSLVFCLLKFAEAIGARLVAEGVETLDELLTLKAVGVHSVQGFYLHRPAEVDDIAALLKNHP